MIAPTYFTDLSLRYDQGLYDYMYLTLLLVATHRLCIDVSHIIAPIQIFQVDKEAGLYLPYAKCRRLVLKNELTGIHTRCT